MTINNKKKYNVAIIGAGTIGLYLALKMKERGYNITVFEQRDKVGTDVCSGIFSEKIFNFIPESKNIIENEIKSAFLHFPKKTIELNFKERFFLFSHTKLDEILFEKVKENIIFNKKILSIPSGFDKIIGCDGANSFTRNYLKLKKPAFKVGMRGFLEKKDYSNFVETWPLKNGFIWKIPRGEVVEYGIMEKPEIAKKILDNFLKKNKIILKKLESRVIPAGISLPNNNFITLCGDSTGITKPWSGGGVIWGIKNANILLDSFPSFEDYNKKVRRIKGKMILYSALTKIVYYAGSNFSKVMPKKIKIEPDFII